MSGLCHIWGVICPKMDVLSILSAGPLVHVAACRHVVMKVGTCSLLSLLRCLVSACALCVRLNIEHSLIPFHFILQIFEIEQTACFYKWRSRPSEASANRSARSAPSAGPKANTRTGAAAAWRRTQELRHTAPVIRQQMLEFSGSRK